MKNVRITVLKVAFDEALAERYLTDGAAAGPCPYFKVGDTFLYEGGAQMPQGFCPWAWVDIYTNLSALAAGGTYTPWNNAGGETIACCTDGIRPVSFELKAL
ncbi:TIGR04076 family protein [Allofournierella sp.]|uniref:TIGR04076 family protein n=1 Tax=Allofournierella sp. TaxID=1940256 RepID=UPI003AB7A527